MLALSTAGLSFVLVLVILAMTLVGVAAFRDDVGQQPWKKGEGLE